MDDDGSPSFSPFELFLVRRKQLRRKSAFSTGVALIGLRRRIERNASARYLPFFLRLYNKNYVCCLSFYHSVRENNFRFLSMWRKLNCVEVRISIGHRNGRGSRRHRRLGVNLIAIDFFLSSLSLSSLFFLSYDCSMDTGECKESVIGRDGRRSPYGPLGPHPERD